jgi:hypothetical protein
VAGYCITGGKYFSVMPSSHSMPITSGSFYFFCTKV